MSSIIKLLSLIILAALFSCSRTNSKEQEDEFKQVKALFKTTDLPYAFGAAESVDMPTEVFKKYFEPFNQTTVINELDPRYAGSTDVKAGVLLSETEKYYALEIEAYGSLFCFIINKSGNVLSCVPVSFVKEGAGSSIQRTALFEENGFINIAQTSFNEKTEKEEKLDYKLKVQADGSVKIMHTVKQEYFEAYRAIIAFTSTTNIESEWDKYFDEISAACLNLIEVVKVDKNFDAVNVETVTGVNERDVIATLDITQIVDNYQTGYLFIDNNSHPLFVSFDTSTDILKKASEYFSLNLLKE